MRQSTRHVLAAASLALIAAGVGGCSSSNPQIFTFSHREGGNVAASDNLGAALASRSNTAHAAAKPNDTTRAASAEPTDPR